MVWSVEEEGRRPRCHNIVVSFFRFDFFVDWKKNKKEGLGDLCRMRHGESE